jgi:hypothetical protein
MEDAMYDKRPNKKGGYCHFFRGGIKTPFLIFCSELAALFILKMHPLS